MGTNPEEFIKKVSQVSTKKEQDEDFSLYFNKKISKFKMR